MKPLAKFQYRILSAVIDILIFLVVFYIFILFFGEHKKDKIFVTGFPAFILFIITFILYPLSEIYSGQTIGKRIVNIKVVNHHYQQISFSEGLLRFVLSIIDMFFLIGLFLIIFTKKRQRIGDIIAKTLVIDLN